MIYVYIGINGSPIGTICNINGSSRGINGSSIQVSMVALYQWSLYISGSSMQVSMIALQVSMVALYQWQLCRYQWQLYINGSSIQVSMHGSSLSMIALYMYQCMVALYQWQLYRYQWFINKSIKLYRCVHMFQWATVKKRGTNHLATTA